MRKPLAALTAALSVATLLAPAAHAEPGRPSAGDRVFRHLGNEGYDVRSYDVRFDYRPGVMTMRSSVRIAAVATRDLTGFSLDSAGQRIGSVLVDGERAAYRLSGEKLIITPRRPLRANRAFTVTISYTADRRANPPSPATPKEPPHRPAWVGKKDGFALLGQPDRAHLFFPMNDHPSDKARVTFRVTVPKGLRAVANGSLRSRTVSGDRVTYTYATRDPIPTHVVQAAVGRFREHRRTGPGGLPVRSYVAPSAYRRAEPLLNEIPAQLAWLSERLGSRFPYEGYGVLGVDGDYGGVALETATLSTYSAQALGGPLREAAPVAMHELVHQYFGNAVAVRTWDDMWISEGHADYYQTLYSAEKGYLRFPSLAERMRALYAFDGEKRVESGPPGRVKSPLDVLVGSNAGGSLMLYGLNRTVGERTFREIERTFFARFRHRSATTRDYIRVANEVSGRDLTRYIEGWIYGRTTPPMPGHPDWKPAAASS